MASQGWKQDMDLRVTLSKQVGQVVLGQEPLALLPSPSSLRAEAWDPVAFWRKNSGRSHGTEGLWTHGSQAKELGGGVAVMVPGVSGVNSQEGAVPWKDERRLI